MLVQPIKLSMMMLMPSRLLPKLDAKNAGSNGQNGDIAGPGKVTGNKLGGRILVQLVRRAMLLVLSEFLKRKVPVRKQKLARPIKLSMLLIPSRLLVSNEMAGMLVRIVKMVILLVPSEFLIRKVLVRKRLLIRPTKLLILSLKMMKTRMLPKKVKLVTMVIN